MHIEHVDVLRCPRAHEDSWLVASIEAMDAREIVRGTLGCPVCGAQYAVRDREVQMGGTPSASCEPADAEAALRLAALLDLAEPGGLALLAGSWGGHAPALRALVDQRLLLLDPPANVPTDVGIYALLAPADTLPIAEGTLRAVALDESHAACAAAAVRALRAGGRLVAPVGVDVPDGVSELARDDELWVGAREGAVRLVGLRRG